MQKEILELSKSVRETGAHIFYYFHDEERYIENVMDYIHCAIKQGNHIMIIENDRIMPLIEKKIVTEFSKNQNEMIHTINNYDFYCYRGNFHKETILNYLENMIAPYLENNIPIQTWAHVEWREQNEIFTTIGEYEQEADKMLQHTDLVTICAYDADRVPPTLKETLLKCHDYYMTDHGISIIDRNVAMAE
jgi:hypothetical protein